MLQATSILILPLMLQSPSSQQPQVSEKLQISCEPVLAAAKPTEVETADEKAARYDADFERALMQIDKCLNKVLVSAGDAGGGGGSGSNGAGGETGSGSGANGTLQGTEQPASTAPENNGAPSETEAKPGTPAPTTQAPNTTLETPSDIPSKAGDDVIAQQLRELAAKEPDPVLRKKYWNQYRKYKGLKEID